MSPSGKEIIAALIGVCIGGFLTYNLIPDGHEHNHTHEDGEYHVHADFLIQIEDQTLDLNRPELMTNNLQQLHGDAHLHDDEGKVLHLHKEGVAFTEFLSSLGIILSEDCLELIGIEEYCVDETKSLGLYVNNEKWSEEAANYVPSDLDRILLFYGEDTAGLVQTHLDNVSNDACIYSGSCLERGIAPDESCGLTCEL